MFQDGSGETRLLLSALVPSVGRQVRRPSRPPGTAGLEIEGEPPSLSLPTALLAATQPVAESYRAPHLRCEPIGHYTTASFYRSLVTQLNRLTMEEERFDLRGLTRLTP